MEQVSLYIHIPYCKTKCGYCDFNSYPGREWEHRGYTQAVLKELEHRAGVLSGALVPSIFFGGGTPTLLGAGPLNTILARCRDKLNLAPQGEISVEANPETVSSALLEALLKAGFNRISVGVQSFNNDNLRMLGRAHDGEQAALAVRKAEEAGFENVSIDLMFGIPGQGPDGWEEDIDAALSLHPQHISAYGLKIEEKTPFDRLLKEKIISLPGEEIQSGMFYTAVDRFTGAGYEHYEISNFALPGRRSAHNLNYWKSGAYLGLGAGAHSYLRGERSSNLRDPGGYTAGVNETGSAAGFREKLSPRAALGEALMLGLRLTEGVDMREYGERFGFDLRREYGAALRELSRHGLIEIMEEERLKLTRRGLILSDEVFLRLL